MKGRIVFLLLVGLCSGLVQVPVHRLIQYDYEGTSFGSQVASFNFLGAHFKNESEVPRKIALVHETSLTQEILENTIALKPSALLIILSSGAGLTREIQVYLGSNTFHFPIYFAYETAELLEVYESLLVTGEQTIDSDQLQFSITSEEKSLVKNLQQENFYGFAYEFSENLPTIAVVTYLDAFSVVPELTKGVDSNGSGVIIALELIRLMKKVYDKSPAPYNLLFVFTSSGTTNLQGLRHWATAEESELQQIRGNILFALCLDTLGQSENLYMHVSRFQKDGETELTNIYTQFNATAEKSDILLDYKKKKVNMADSFVPWQHEIFAKNKIVSATLSHLENSRSGIVDYSSVFDDKLDMGILQRNIKFVAESLAKYLYNVESTVKNI
jgi:hypothetical protein